MPKTSDDRYPYCALIKSSLSKIVEVECKLKDYVNFHRNKIWNLPNITCWASDS